MRDAIRRSLLSVVILIAASSTAWGAATRYVTDRLEVTLRSGQTNEHRIVKMLVSGTPLEILEDDAASGYSRVRTQDGTDGWVLTRYLLAQPVARDQLVQAEQTVAQLQSEVTRLKEQLANVSGDHKTLEKEQQSLDAQNRRLQEELNKIRQTAANALNLDSENQTLKNRVFTLETESQVLKQQTDTLKDRSQRDWFIAGAGVIFAGIILGLILPRIKLRKKSGWDSL